MVNRQSILDELQELRTLVRQQDCDQVQLHVRLFVHTCDRLTTPIVSPPKGASYDPPIYPAEDIGLSIALVRSLRGYVAEAASAIESDPQDALKALDEALEALDTGRS
jgi:hypothetical protein